ncbi:MAG: UbiA family prenyltransferase [Bacteroidia bacterium]
MRLLHFLIETNIFISLAAVLLTLETQIQLGMEPQLHPYLFIIFFATLFEYNVHRFITAITNPEALDSDKHVWVKTHLKGFYTLVAFSVSGFLISALFAKKDVLLTLAPIGVITLFYSLPVFKKEKIIFRLREIPVLKIFLISFVWSASTILLPIIQSGRSYHVMHILEMLVERFIFVFAITLPFDIRDMSADTGSGLKTIPLLIGEKNTLLCSYFLLALFALIAFFHYSGTVLAFLWPALGLSAISTMVFIGSRKLRGLRYYHYGILDGTMLLQGFLACLAYYLQ